VVAHMHYVLVGGMLFPLLAGFYYWLPHLSGRMPTERFGRWGFWLTFIGFNTTFLLMHVTGLLGMPRRVYTYQADLGWDWLNLLSSIGAFIMAAGVAMIILDIVLHFRFGRVAESNPWQADTLEWAMRMPPPSYNFASLPTVKTRHPLWEHPELLASIAAGEHALIDITHGRRETYSTDAITGRVREIIHLPSNSWLPLQAAFALAVVCICLLLRTYPMALLATLAALYLLLRWSWHNGGHPRAQPLGEDEPVDPPLHSRSRRGPGLWGMVTTLMANGTLYLSLLFGWFYLWAVAPQWVVPADGALTGPIALSVLLGSGVILTLAVLWYTRTLARLRTGNVERLQGCLLGVAGLGLLHFLLLLWVLLKAGLSPTEQAHDSLLTVMLIYLLLHSALAVVLTGMQAKRVALGYVSSKLPYEPEVLKPFWFYTLGIFWSAFAAFILLPSAWGAL
jgi:cytochrome c oxidase subunit I+III